MSEAPERIWGYEDGQGYGHFYRGKERDCCVEYVRADRIAAVEARIGHLIPRADLDAAVAAALREAVDTASTWWDDPQMREAILALIPDAGKALDRALAEERERCAKVAEKTPGAGRVLRQDIAAAIRAQKEE